MEQLYLASGICRQSFHNWLDNKMQKKELYNQLLPLVQEIRVEHPGMSSRVIYSLIKPPQIGRTNLLIGAIVRGSG